MTSTIASTRTRSLGLLLALAVLGMVAVTSVAVGARGIPLGRVFESLVAFDPEVSDHQIVRSLRVPRTIMGVVVGAALGLAGAVMQGVARNPLADPGILGVNAGAALAVVVAIHLFGIGDPLGYVWFAVVGAGLASTLVYLLGSVGAGGTTPVKLALAGAATSAMLASITSAILLLDITTFDRFRFWAVGSLAGRDPAALWQLAPLLVLGTALALTSARVLNAMALGEEVARSLGQRLVLARLHSAGAVVLLVGVATSLAGPIGFVGLTVPHIARSLVGPDHRWLLPYSAVLAGILLLGADVVGRVVVRPGELQVGIVTALIGAPVFVALVRRRRMAML